MTAPRDRLARLLDRMFPHDTLMIGGRPYMDRWYVFGYAPTPDDPDAEMICAVKGCGAPVVPGCSAYDGSGSWSHIAEVFDCDHTAVGISAPRSGWRWNDHGLGAFRIHRTVASDDSRAFHDHPWSFVSVGVRGSYTEIRPAIVDTDGGACAVTHHRNHRRTFRAPFVNRKAATDLHVLAVERGPVWTLFFTRPKVRSWGFAIPGEWVPWREFDERFPERDAWVQP